MADPIISTADLGNYLGRDLVGDAGGTIAVDAASEVVRTISEQQFTAGTSTETYDGTGTDALLLRQGPVHDAGTVVVNGGTVTDYKLNGHGVLLRTAGAATPMRWPKGRQNIEVTYEHGYDEIPADVRMVALAYAARVYVQGPAEFESIGPHHIRYAIASTDLSNGEKAVLRKHRR